MLYFSKKDMGGPVKLTIVGHRSSSSQTYYWCPII